ncbi:MAG: hypothetical protein J2P38_00845, partial [Candidatus Dormibacteraeota bacterium]|nr:hypothetical protein [Candidatus Dormibacteraeota bacterium]
VMWGVLIAVLLWELALCTVQVLGTLHRWVWWYWVQFAIGCLSAVSLVITLFDVLELALHVGGGGSPTLAVYRSEGLIIPLTLIGDVLNVGAAVCMLIAAVRIGPWATTRDAGRLGIP